MTDTAAIAASGLAVHPAGAARPALADVALRVAPGERLAVIGPSGAGKTTLLSVLGAALRPDAGELRIFDRAPWELGGTDLRSLRGRLFLAPQMPPLPPRQRVVTAVLAGRLPGLSALAALGSLLHPADPQAAHAALARFGLQDRLWDRVDRLSGGERQRVSLARALVSRAELFLVDEPLSALDPTLALRTLEALVDAAAARGAALVCSLHQVELARRHFPRLVGLRDGRLLFDLPTARVDDRHIEALYRDRDADPPAAVEDAVPAPARLPAGRCD